MKHLLKIALGLVVCMAAMVSCDDDDDKGIAGFSLDKEDVTVGADGGTEAVIVNSENEWTAISTAPWINVSPANGLGTTECRIVVDSTMSDGSRKAEIRFLSKGLGTQKITVFQTGYGKIISLEKQEIEILDSDVPDKRYFEIKVTTNIPFRIETEYGSPEKNGWVTLHEKDPNPEFDREYRPRTVKVRFDWNMNPDSEQRIARIHFVPKNETDEINEPVMLTVIQKAAPRITDDRAGDSLAILLIGERLNVDNTWDTSENIRNWIGVKLWERADKDLPAPEAVGRIRSVEFALFNTKESIPQEVHYLKYVETLYFYSNVNTMLKSIDLGTDICDLQYLKHLTIGAYGLVSLPGELAKLGGHLETLDLRGNNFTSIPSVLKQENFPALKKLDLGANRRWGVSDLRKANDAAYTDGIGLHMNTGENNSLRQLFLWEKLEQLVLSYNYLEGEVPDFTVGESGVRAYTQADVEAFGGDTIQYLADRQMPRILPNMKRLSINLNFFTGKLPDWILYHPHLILWNPKILVYNQMENGLNSEGNVVKFDNEPTDFDYYYEAFPKLRKKYEYQEETTE